MFIPTNFDGQIFRESEKKVKKEKIKKKNLSATLFVHPSSLLCFDFIIIFSFFYQVGPTCPFLFLLGPFKPRNKLFYPGFNFLYPN